MSDHDTVVVRDGGSGGAMILALVVLWARAAGGNPQGQMLGVVFMTVMAVEMSIGFALITGVYRVRRADITEKLRRLKG